LNSSHFPVKNACQFAFRGVNNQSQFGWYRVPLLCDNKFLQ
jgi:hypothetical protein